MASLVATPEEEQDALRPVRQFIQLLSGIASDQSYAGEDGRLWNPANQFRVLGPQGTAVEGRAVIVGTTAGGGLVLSPGLVLIGAGLAAWLLLKR